MSAYTNSSNDFSDIKKIVEDLTRGISAVEGNAKLGFLTCDSLVDYESLLTELSTRIDFPIVGGTTFTYPLSGDPLGTSAALTVLSLDHLAFSIHITEPLAEERSLEQVTMVYQECLAGLGSVPKLFMPFIPMSPGLKADQFFTDLFSLAGPVPVFGGVTTDDLDTTKAAVFAGGKVYHDRMVLIALGGAIQPVFSVGSQLTPMSEYAPTVTKSDANIVYQVDDMTFCDYMRSIGISPEERKNGVDALAQYGPLPCRLRNKLTDDDGIPELRCISYTNVEEGSAAFSSCLPVGTKVNVGVILKEDVVESSRRCLNQLVEKMKAVESTGYHYSTLFSIPCVARYFAMLGGENLESMLLTEEIPEHLAISTYYGFCEIGPTQGEEGTIHNRSHNASVVMCAI